MRHENRETLMESSFDQSMHGKMEMAEFESKVASSSSIKVQAMAFDDYVYGEGLRPDVIKIGVEGAASFIFACAQTALLKMRSTLFIELHGPEYAFFLAQQKCYSRTHVFRARRLRLVSGLH